MRLPRTREWRESRGLTQRQLAEEASVGPATIPRIERGESVLPTTAKKIADALGINVVALLFSPPDAYSPPEIWDVLRESVLDFELLDPPRRERTFYRTYVFLDELLEREAYREDGRLFSEVLLACQYMNLYYELARERGLEEARDRHLEGRYR